MFSHCQFSLPRIFVTICILSMSLWLLLPFDRIVSAEEPTPTGGWSGRGSSLIPRHLSPTAHTGGLGGGSVSPYICDDSLLTASEDPIWKIHPTTMVLDEPNPMYAVGMSRKHGITIGYNVLGVQLCQGSLPQDTEIFLIDPNGVSYSMSPDWPPGTYGYYKYQFPTNAETGVYKLEVHANDEVLSAAVEVTQYASEVYQGLQIALSEADDASPKSNFHAGETILMNFDLMNLVEMREYQASPIEVALYRGDIIHRGASINGIDGDIIAASWSLVDTFIVDPGGSISFTEPITIPHSAMLGQYLLIADSQISDATSHEYRQDLDHLNPYLVSMRNRQNYYFTVYFTVSSPPERQAIEQQIAEWEYIHHDAVYTLNGNSLDSVLAGQALADQRAALRSLRNRGCYWQIEDVDPFQLTDVEISGNHAVASVEKNWDMDLFCKNRKSGDDDGPFTMRYELERIDGRWYITDKRVVDQ